MKNNMKSTGYDADKSILEIEFIDGDIYQYQFMRTSVAHRQRVRTFIKT